MFFCISGMMMILLLDQNQTINAAREGETDITVTSTNTTLIQTMHQKIITIVAPQSSLKKSGSAM